MDKLRIIIHTLSAEDQQELALFLQRQKRKKERKDLMLLSLLREEEALKADQIIAKLYPDSHNQVAYHALRKRLMRQLTQFIVLKRMDDDPSASSSIMGFMTMARYLFDQRKNRLAWEFLRKAQKLAEKQEHFDLLNHIYTLQIAHAEREFEGDLEELIQVQRKNKILADEDERAAIAYALIKHKLQQIRKKGRDLQFDSTVKEVLDQYQLSEVILQRPRLMFRLISIARSAILVRKDFYHFEPFIIRQYEKMMEYAGTETKHLIYRLEFRYMIAHVLYRNKRFNQSLEYLDELDAEIQSYKKSYFARFHPRSVMLRAANYTFLNRSEESVSLLETLLVQKGKDLKLNDTLNIWVNLGIYYFLRKEYQQVIRCNLELHHSDKWLEKKMGREWVIKKQLSEALLQFELENYDLVENKLKTIERHHGDLLDTPAYSKGKIFIAAIRELLKYPTMNQDELSYQRIRANFPILPIEQEDLQEMAFFAWLKSKLLKVDFYPVLLEMVRGIERA